MNSIGPSNSGSGRGSDAIYIVVMAGVLVLSAMGGAAIGYLIDLAAPDEPPAQAPTEAAKS